MKWLYGGMSLLLPQRAFDPGRDIKVRAEYEKRFSFADVGVRYRERLTAIFHDQLL